MKKLKLAAFCAVTTVALSFSACTKKSEETAPAETTQTAPDTAASPTTTAASTESSTATSVSELKIEDVKVGTGAEATAGKKVTVEYTGKLTNGTQFDSSVGRAPFSFNLGAGQVIQGWEKGIVGMKVGGKRKLTIPPALAYGEQGAGSVIPPNSTLVFDVELLKVE